MKNNRKHIAAILFGLFFFPIIFQSAHVVFDHAHTFLCDHNHHNGSSFHAGSKSQNEIISQTFDDCQVCEYQFSINDLPGVFLFRSVIPAHTLIYNQDIVKQQNTFVYTVKLPRAPPHQTV